LLGTDKNWGVVNLVSIGKGDLQEVQPTLGQNSDLPFIAFVYEAIK
jgi:hypothetical protein